MGATLSLEKAMDVAKLREFGTKYTAAWCSQNAASVANLIAESRGHFDQAEYDRQLGK
jgi:hypothetical protein